MNRSKHLWVAALSLSLVASSTAGYAALSAATDSRVSFGASGPAGMKIEGTTADLSVADDGANVVTTVPLANLTTGIGLRDHHMKEKYLEVPKYPVGHADHRPERAEVSRAAASSPPPTSRRRCSFTGRRAR